jgi:hypothetical protein
MIGREGQPFENRQAQDGIHQMPAFDPIGHIDPPKWLRPAIERQDGGLGASSHVADALERLQIAADRAAIRLHSKAFEGRTYDVILDFGRRLVVNRLYQPDFAFLRRRRRRGAAVPASRVPHARAPFICGYLKFHRATQVGQISIPRHQP